jgi:DNA-binding MurR/RpiR family transcriptional regulator
MGGSAALAFDAYHKFIRTGKQCEFHDDSHLQAMMCSLFTEKDCILAISNTGSNKEMVENLKIASENNVKIIAITSNSKSPLSKVSDVVLTSYGKENRFKSEAMESKISTLSLIDCLFVGVCLKNKEKYFTSLNKIRHAIAKKRY